MGRIITDEQEKDDLLGSIVSFTKYRGTLSSLRGWINFFCTYLIQLPSTWSLIQFDPSLSDEMTDQWKNKNEIWNHANGKTEQHNDLGMAYAQYVTSKNMLQDLTLADSPDIHAFCNDHKVKGDIGKCTPIALWQGITSLEIHDLWISVLSENEHLIIEFLYSPLAYCSILANLPYGTNKKINQEQMKKIFYCEKCQMWTIDQNSINNLIRSINDSIGKLKNKLGKIKNNSR